MDPRFRIFNYDPQNVLVHFHVKISDILNPCEYIHMFQNLHFSSFGHFFGSYALEAPAPIGETWCLKCFFDWNCGYCAWGALCLNRYPGLSHVSRNIFIFFQRHFRLTLCPWITCRALCSKISARHFLSLQPNFGMSLLGKTCDTCLLPLCFLKVGGSWFYSGPLARDWTCGNKTLNSAMFFQGWGSLIL